MTARVAIACSGLGHVRRGNERWACTLAEALHAAGVPVTLLGGGPLEPRCPYRRLWSWPREHRLTRRVFSWDWRYRLEQLSFAAMLARWLRGEPHRVVHVPDPVLAWRLRRRGARLGAAVIYKDGLALGLPWCGKFAWVQVLAPYYRDLAAARGTDTAAWFVIPHFVDTRRFHPPPDRVGVRAEVLGAAATGVPLVLAVGDFSPESRKRLDWVVEEVARLPAAGGPHLLLAGNAHGSSAARFERHARERLGRRLHLRANLPPERMPSLYRAADVLAHAADREPFGLVLLEALASGLPVVGHRFPVTEWILRQGGQTVDMTVPGQLANVLADWCGDPARRAALGQAARAWAETEFSPDRILPLYQRMYERVCLR